MAYYDAVSQVLGQALSGLANVNRGMPSGNLTYADMQQHVNSLTNLLNNYNQFGGSVPQFNAAGQQTGNVSATAALGSMLGRAEAERTNNLAATEQRYNQLVGNPATLQDYQTRANTLLSERFDPVTAGFQQRQDTLTAQLDGLGAQGRADLQTQYAQQRSKADQDLTSRGLGNTTVRSSVMGGLGDRESAELRRYDEGLRGQKIALQSQLWGDTLGSKRDVAGVAQQLTGEPLDVVRSRTDNTPSLADLMNMILNASATEGNRFSMGGYAPQTTFR